MKIDLCKIFGVEEGEEFRIEHWNYKDAVYKVEGDSLRVRNEDSEEFSDSCMCINDIKEFKNIIKLPKRKEFTDDELAIMRSLPKKYEWISRDRDDMLYAFCSYKPKKENNYWDNKGLYKKLDFFDHLFQNIQWEDEEPVCIDDYVER